MFPKKLLPLLLFIIPLLIYSQIIKDDFRLNSDTEGAWSYQPAVSVTENGQVLIVWYDYRNGLSNIYAQMYDSLSNPIGTNFKMSEYGGGWSEYSPDATNYNDSIFVVWERGYGRWLNSDGSFAGYSFFFLPISADEPHVAATDSGLFIVWGMTRNPYGRDVVLQRFDFNGDSLSSKIVVNDDGTSQTQFNPRITAVNGKNFIVSWSDYRNGSDWDVYAQLFNSSGQPIGSNFLVSDTAFYQQFNTSCAMDTTGRFLITWGDSRLGNYDIFGQFFDNAGTRIDTNFIVNKVIGTYSEQQHASAMSPSGKTVVAWWDNRNSIRSIYGQLYDEMGIPVDTNFKIDEDTLNFIKGSPEVGMNEDKFIIAWQDGREPTQIYKRAYYNDGTPFESEIRVSEVSGACNQEEPNIDMNSTGDIGIVWEDDRPENGVYFQRMHIDGDTLGGNIRVFDQTNYKPDVAVSDDGLFAIVYTPTNYDITVQRLNNIGDTVGPPIVINNPATQYCSNPSIDMDVDNNIYITWQDDRNGNADIFLSVLNWDGGEIMSNVQVNDDTTTVYNTFPDVVSHPSGDFLVTWYDNRDGQLNIYAQIYDDMWNPVGENILINDLTKPGAKIIPEAAALPGGNYVITWQNNAAYGRIIDSLGNPVDTVFRISENNSVNYVDVFSSNSGKFVATWFQWDVTDNNIHAQQYNSDYTKLGENYRVNNEIEAVNLQQYSPGVVTDGNHIIYTWQDAKWQLGYDIACKVLDWEYSSVDEEEPISKNIRLLPASPNPFFDRTNISFALDRARAVDISIYDITGRLVKNLLSEKRGPGMHSITWNGRSEIGKKASSGIYFCHLKAGDSTTSMKVVLLR